MKTATVEDLRNDFRKISAWIENGETVQILKQGRPFARLMAESVVDEAQPHTKIDFAALQRRIWGDRVFSKEEVEAMREAELEGEEG